MEKNKERDIIKGILSKDTPQHAPDHMTAYIVDAWKKQSASALKPIIPAWILWFIGTAFICTVIVLSSQSNGTQAMLWSDLSPLFNLFTGLTFDPGLASISALFCLLFIVLIHVFWLQHKRVDI